MHYSENTADAIHALPNDLSVSQDGPVTLLRLSRPTKRNALVRNMIAGIEGVLPLSAGRHARRRFAWGGQQFLCWA